MDKKFAINKRNVLWIIIGFCIMVLGYLLMSGGASKDPNVFSPEIFSFRRLTIAPIVLVIGIVCVGWAIMRKHKD